MVSFEASTSPNQRKTIPEFENFRKKRKWEEEEEEENFKRGSKVENTKSLFDIGFHLERPLPLEWKRCLDIQSGQMHFYNSKTQKRTCRDPRQSPERLSPGPMSLDLQLNLPCNSLMAHVDDNWTKPNPDHSPSHINSSTTQSKNFDLQMKGSNALTRSPSWISFEADHREMVAAVCMRCHMLVMLCKSSPACPNCKFMHPAGQSPANFCKPSFSLLCCKD